MISLLNRIKQNILTMVGVFCFFFSVAQLPTYIIDENFNTGELFRSAHGALDFHFLEDGRILVAGGFENVTLNGPLQGGFGMIYSNGTHDNSWSYDFFTEVIKIIPQSDGYVYPGGYQMDKITLDGEPWIYAHGDYWGAYTEGANPLPYYNPYNVERLVDIHQQDDGKLLIAGAIATDTLQPFLFRGLTRLLEDGSHDAEFPIINITPNDASGRVRHIFPSPDGSWYISGGFTAINGHETNHVAKLTPEFQVDTEFVSPFMYDGLGSANEDIILVDSQSRVWVSGYKMRLQENPTDTIQIIRLLPNGEVDTNFIPRTTSSNYSEDLGFLYCLASEAHELESSPGNYIIAGGFSHFNGTPQASITVVNDNGEIQDHLFQGLGATENNWSPNFSLKMPVIYHIHEFDNGDLLIGGAFSEFMGETHYNVVRLKLGFLDTNNQSALNQKFKLWPNPVSHSVNISFEGLVSGEMKIMNLQGELVQRHEMRGFSANLDSARLPSAEYPFQLDVSGLARGVYFVSLETEEGIAVKKMVVD